MYGYILRLDADRQKRVGTNQLQKLLKPEIYNAIKSKETKLNSSCDYRSPFAPTIVRPSFYPTFLRATDIRTIYWKIKNHTEFHDLERLFVDLDSNLVFEFSEELTQDKVDRLLEVLTLFNHYAPEIKESHNKTAVIHFVDERTVCQG